MKSVNVNFIGKNWNAVDPTTIHLHKILSKKFNLFSSPNPDYIITKEEPDFYTTLFSSPEYKTSIRIFFAGEAIFPDFNIFDYALGNDEFSFGDRYLCYTPMMFVYNYHFLDRLLKKNVSSPSKTQFCNFVYRNPHGHAMRDLLFHEISKYKWVDSLGDHLNNQSSKDNPYLRYNPNWLEESIILKSPFKFSITAENAYYNGYTSEKILTSFLAKTIPIYWGNPIANKYFNPKAFIDCHTFESIGDLIKWIKKIDENDDLFSQFLSEPPLTEFGIETAQTYETKILDFFTRIFDQPLQKAGRRGLGYWPSNYERWISTRIAKPQKSIFSKFLDKFQIPR